MDELDDAAEGAHSQSKDIEFSLRPGSCSILESQDMLIPSEGDLSRARQFTDTRDIKNVNRSVSFEDPSAPPSASHRLMDDPGDMVQELTVRNCNGGSLAVVGTSNNKDSIQPQKSHWQRVYPLVGGSGSGNSFVNTAFGDRGQAVSIAREDTGDMAFTDFLAQNVSSDDQNEISHQLTNIENKKVAANVVSHGSIRTKVLSKSGFAKFFVKNSLKGKGIISRGPPQEVQHAQPRGQNNSVTADGTAVASSLLPNLCTKTVTPPFPGIAGIIPPAFDHDGITMREWLKVGSHKVNKVESLYIFRQILDLVDYSHAQGVALQDFRPSRFKLLPSHQVKYLGSPTQREMLESVMDQDTSHLRKRMIRKRATEEEVSRSMKFCDKKQRFSENANIARRWPLFPSRSGLKQETYYDGYIIDPRNSLKESSEHNRAVEYGAQGQPRSAHMSNTVQQLTCISNQLEEKWYRSPEELGGRGCTMSSNIYSLGVLLFELLGHFKSESAHAAAMLDLRDRILPPNFLSENLKEAGFCLWLLHPEPSSRPTTREILQSEVISGLQDVCTEDLSSSIDQAEAESELLLHFLTALQEQKQKKASKLAEDLECVEADIEEIRRRHSSKYFSVHSDNMFFHEPSRSEVPSGLSQIQNTNEVKLERNINQLETAYFSMRSKIQLRESDATRRQDNDLLRNRDSWYLTQKDEEEEHCTDPIGTFFDGVCKYARYSKFKLRGILRNGDLNSSANVICSLSFDRDKDYFAAAGVSKKIKIFEFNALLNDFVDIHYPVIEMSNKSKLSCVSWNSYIKNYLASTDYDGIVKLWDASTGQGFSQYIEHQKRAWSVDFSQIDPKKFASGSDDCSVKLWSINEKNCLGSIPNIANVCCVQFSPHSSNLLAFGSADYRTYCYDLRNVKTPWCVLTGHEKAVSYVKFLDSETLVSASTDNTLKIWDLNRTNPTGPSTDACSLTLGGHTNEKNFVGLSVADGYITCGSETNEVYAYHRSLPMPITSHKFGSIDPISGKETDDDNGQFVSSVCWREKSDMVIAANSTGCIKVLEMV